jgi:hypothetical protein
VDMAWVSLGGFGGGGVLAPRSGMRVAVGNGTTI